MSGTEGTILPVPRLSVIVPAYNVEKYLARCLDSLLSQSAPPSEILVIVDGATDDSLRIAREYAGRHATIRVIEQENVGLGATRNRGIRESTGDYILFVDSDDALRRGALELIAKRIEESAPDMVAFSYSFWFQNGARYPQRENPTIAPHRVLRGEDTDLLLSNAMYFAWAAAYRREFLIEADIRNGEGYLFEDQEFTISAILEAELIAVIHEPLYLYFSNPDSILRSPTPEMSRRRIDGRIKSINAVIEAARARGASERAKGFLADHEYVDLVSFYTRDGHAFDVRSEFLSSLTEFFAAIEPADHSLVGTNLRRLYESGAIANRDYLAISDALYEDLAEEYSRVTNSLAYRVARKAGNMRARLLRRNAPRSA